MPTNNLYLDSQIVVQTAAQWAVDATVYSAKRILVTSDAYYGATDQRKFKIADGVQAWSALDYFPVSGYDDASSSIQGQLNGKQATGSYEVTTAKDATGGYVGLTLFKINFKNVANTITSFFTNSNTIARTYTFQNRDGTIADDTDLAAKQATLVSGTNIKTINSNSLLGAGDLAISGLPVATAAGTADAITADYTPDLTLTNLTICVFVATAANATTTPTFSPDGLTAHTITKNGGQPLAAGDIPGALAVCIVEYNAANTRWELLNPKQSASGAVAGSNTQVQFNDAGSFGGDADLAWDKTTNILTVLNGAYNLNGGSTGAEKVALGNRVGVGFPVPYFTPTTNNTAIAYDIFPKGSPADVASYLGVAWIDICSTDIVADGTNYECLRLGKLSSGISHVGSAKGGTGTLRDLILQLQGGNVGIGALTTPQFSLHVNTGTTSTFIQVTNSTTGHTSSDGLVMGVLNSDAYIIQRENAKLIFYTNNTEKASIDAAGLVNVVGLTASRAIVTDASKNLASSATTATELGYLNGVTSAVQTQINTKLAKSAVPCEFIVACSDLSTALTTGTTKAYFRAPYAFTLTAVRASLGTAQASGSIFTVDINESGTSVLSTKLTIDNTELTSTTAATQAVISDSAIADDAILAVDIDQIGDGTAKGLIVTLIGTHAV